MTWVRVDDTAPLHPKLLRVGPEAAWLWVCGLAHCNRSTTNGRIEKVFLPALYPSGHYTPKRLSALADVLVAARLWVDDGDAFQIHEYEHQQELAMKEHVEARREYDRERKRAKRGRDKSGTLSGTSPGQVPGNVRDPDADIPHASETPSRPVPSRPVPTSRYARSGERARGPDPDSPPARLGPAPLRPEHLEHLHAESKRALGRAWFGLDGVCESWDGGGLRPNQRDAEHCRSVLGWASDPERTGGLDPRSAITRAVDGYATADDPFIRKSKHSLALFAAEPGRWLDAGQVASAEPDRFDDVPSLESRFPQIDGDQ